MKNTFKIHRIWAMILSLSIILFTACDGETPEAIPAPTADFTFSPTTPDVGEEVTFTVVSENATAYSWSFGDANSSTEMNPVHSYSSEADYTVTLIATGEGGNVTVTKNVSVVKQAEKAEVYFIDNTDDVFTMKKLSGIGLDITIEDAFTTTGYAIHTTYHAGTNKVYYSDDDNGQIVSVNLDGSSETIVTTDIEQPRGLALNDDGTILYAADRFTGEISSFNIANGTKTVLYDSLDFSSVAGFDPAFNFIPVGLAYNNGQLYITCVEIDAEATWKGAADGSSLTRLNDYFDAGYGYAVTVDAQNDQLIFDNRDGGELLSSDLSGGSISTFASTGDGAKTYGIWVDEVGGKVYWSTDLGYITRSDLDGSNKEDLSFVDIRVNRGLFVVRTDQ